MSVVSTYGLGGTRQLRVVRTTSGKIVIAIHDLAAHDRWTVTGSLTLTTAGEVDTLRSALGDVLGEHGSDAATEPERAATRTPRQRRGHSVSERQPTEVFIPGPLPGLNEILAAAKSGHGRGNAYARLKAAWLGIVVALARRCRPVHGRVSVAFEWREPNRRRDLDNVSAGGTKIVLDGLVLAGVIDGDGQRDVVALAHSFGVDADAPGVLVRVEPAAGGAP